MLIVRTSSRRQLASGACLLALVGYHFHDSRGHQRYWPTCSQLLLSRHFLRPCGSCCVGVAYLAPRLTLPI